MSNYQRLISYMYTYEGGIKGKNIGFAKIERRGGQCKITVSVKKIFVGGNPMGIYLLSNKQELRIGTLFSRNGTGEFRTIVNAYDVEGSGLGMEGFYGLSIHDTESTWRSYTTIWEDAVAHAAEVELADVTSQKVAMKRSQETQKEDEKQEELPISKEIEEELRKEELLEQEKRKNNEEVSETEEDVIAEEKTESENIILFDGKKDLREHLKSEDRMELQEEKKPKKVNKEEAQEQKTEEIEKKEEVVNQERKLPYRNIWGREENRGIRERLIESGEIQSGYQTTSYLEEPAKHSLGSEIELQTEQILKEEPASSNPIKSQEEDSIQSQEEDSIQSQEDNSVQSREEDSAQSQEEDSVQNQEKISAQSGKEDWEEARQEQNSGGTENCSEEEMWTHLRKRYPKVLAFDYEDGCEILTIKPQDIGLLPRETWVYGNNSFLLHGYYNYRYLILARLNNKDGAPRYLLGIPGHYYSNEKYMAAMFGFPDFVLSKRQPSKDGRFGYWYTDLKLGD